MNDEAKQRVHEAIQDWLDDDEIAICWVLTIDVAGPAETRYLAHRAGGGIDGDDNPMAWTALGMLQASARLAEEQVLDMTVTVSDSDSDSDEDTDPGG